MVEVERGYYDPKQPGSFAGVDKWYRHQSERSRRQVKDWLRSEDAYTLHKPVRYNFPRNKVVVGYIDHQWDCDLVSMQGYIKSNDGFAFILVATDILSHYCWTRALTKKTADEVVKALSSIFSEGRVPTYMRTDMGGEFTGARVQRFLTDNNVKHFVAYNTETKANYVERLNRTLKLRMSRYFTHKQTVRWIDILQDVTYSYNHTFHRTIGRTPVSVNRENQAEVWEKQYGDTIAHNDPPYAFKVGDTVRISHIRRAFQREYDERYTGELFKVKTRTVRAGLNIYSLEDFHAEPLKGTFYEKELQKVTADNATLYKIEKVIKSRKRRGQEREHWVKFLHWPAKFNQWIKQSDMQDL